MDYKVFVFVQSIRSHAKRLRYAFPLSFLKTLVHLREAQRENGASC